MQTKQATDILKSWLSAPGRIEAALDVMAEAHRQCRRVGPRLPQPLARVALEVFLIRGISAEIVDWDAYRVARDTVSAADMIDLSAWVESMRYDRSPDPIEAIIRAWKLDGFDGHDA